MPPRGRPPTRSQSRAKSVAVVPQAQALTNPEGHVQTLVEGASELPAPKQPQPLGPTPFSTALPAQLQAVSQLLDVLERRSHGIIQREMAAMAQAAANQQNPRQVPRSPTWTTISQRRPHPTYDPVPSDPISEPVPRRKHCGKPPTPPSPPRSGSPSSSSPPSSDSSSSSREPSPHKKKNKEKVKSKTK